MQFAPLLSIVVLALAGSCRSTEPIPEIGFERVESGQLGFGHAAKNAVVRDIAEWQAFCEDDVIGDDQGAWNIARNTDWSKHMLIAVSLGSRPSGGYAVEIDRVYQKGSRWIVHARETRPAAGSMQTAMVTSPFDCVVTPRFDGKVDFIVE